MNAKVALLVVLTVASDPSRVVAEDLSAPEKNFEFLWQTFDRGYGNFIPKQIDWDLIYNVYRPRVTAATTDEELFAIMSDMLGNLNDNHVNLVQFQDNNPKAKVLSKERVKKEFNAGILHDLPMEDFSLGLIKEKYLDGKAESRAAGVFHFGLLKDSIGYFHFDRFRDPGERRTAIDEIVRVFKDAKGLVVDVRSNGGGSDQVGKLLADRFADRKRLYMVTRNRNGPKHDDFQAPKEFFVEPGGPLQFTKPVILLTHRHSVSAAENFTLAMRRLPHVTVVGDTTSGAFADVSSYRLPNGWRVSMPFNLFVDHRGLCWEGIGLTPHIRQINRKEDLRKRRDRVLELAIALIDTGAINNRPEPPEPRDAGQKSP